MNLYEISLDVGIKADSLEESITKLRNEIGKIDVFYTRYRKCNEAMVISKDDGRLLPIKVTHDATKKSTCTCPRCLNSVDEFINIHGKRVRVTNNYCKICGQLLDWSDEID